MNSKIHMSSDTSDPRAAAEEVKIQTVPDQLLEIAFTNARRLSQSFPAGLYLTATPIGNATDITLRALQAFACADIVLCEDTRVTAKLMSLYGLSPKLQTYHDHNAAQARPAIMKRLKEGGVIIQVTDAGTPLINDPGYKLVTEALSHDIPVTTLPGACAPIAALTLAGLPTDRFLYVGFPPNKAAARQVFFEDLSHMPSTLVFLESVHRLPASLLHMEQVFGNRKVAVCREITKKFEEVRRGFLSDIAAQYAHEGSPKGEVVVVVGPPDNLGQEWTDERLDRALSQALSDGYKVKEAAQIVADLSGLKKRVLYNRALVLLQLDPDLKVVE